MRLCDLIETLCVYESDLCDSDKAHVIKSYSHEEWLDLIDIFLRGIGKQHEVPGSDIWQLYGIMEASKEYELTHKQLWYVFHVIWQNWPQVGAQMRAALML